jgi:hypothetical protein
MLGHLRSLVEGNGLFVSAVVRLKSQTLSLRETRSDVSAVVSIKSHPANSRQVALPRLHANSTGLPGFVRILGISPRLPPSLPTTSVDQNAKAYSHPPTAQVCRFAQTEQSSDRFIKWAAKIILRHRSFLLSINTHGLPYALHALGIAGHAPFKLALQLLVLRA